VSDEKKTAKQLVERNDKGQFTPGQSGNPAGRPLGSKNKVNILKITLEENFRDGNFEKIADILNSVVDDALQGDKQARKMVWEACISKANLSEDKKDTSDAPQIVIKHMEVEKQGDIIDVKDIGEEDA
jgi:hypothetical protein